MTIPMDYFINPNCFGDDLAMWLIRSLTERGVETDSSPSQEDFGWYFRFVVERIEHCVVVGFQPNDLELGDCWIGWLERSVGSIAFVLGERNRAVSPKAIELIDAILSSSPDVHDLTWLPKEVL